MSEEKNSDVQNMSFEESMKVLSELVEQLESGTLDLDKSLEVYERAVAIREHCRAILDEADRKVQKIISTANGDRREDFRELDG
ncbi:exodeoxyribonuclease VII, small subunit [Thermoplasmatales archaeon BRNA1]|nr:exodeoxyribonuclease VII, small subunit [Thermoplasmatales archaeon BRNA1]